MVEKSFSMDKACRSMENPLKAPNGGCWQTRVDGNAVVKSAYDEGIYQRRKKRPGKRLFNGSDPAQNRETRSCRLRHIGSESQMSIEYHAKVFDGVFWCEVGIIEHDWMGDNLTSSGRLAPHDFCFFSVKFESVRR